MNGHGSLQILAATVKLWKAICTKRRLQRTLNVMFGCLDLMIQLDSQFSFQWLLKKLN